MGHWKTLNRRASDTGEQFSRKTTTSTWETTLLEIRFIEKLVAWWTQHILSLNRLNSTSVSELAQVPPLHPCPLPRAFGRIPYPLCSTSQGSGKWSTCGTKWFFQLECCWVVIFWEVVEIWNRSTTLFWILSERLSEESSEHCQAKWTPEARRIYKKSVSEIP